MNWAHGGACMGGAGRKGRAGLRFVLICGLCLHSRRMQLIMTSAHVAQKDKMLGCTCITRHNKRPHQDWNTFVYCSAAANHTCLQGYVYCTAPPRLPLSPVHDSVHRELQCRCTVDCLTASQVPQTDTGAATHGRRAEISDAQVLVSACR